LIGKYAGFNVGAKYTYVYDCRRDYDGNLYKYATPTVTRTNNNVFLGSRTGLYSKASTPTSWPNWNQKLNNSSNNVAIGYRAFERNSFGGDNIAIGRFAMFARGDIQSGSYNVAIGFCALADSSVDNNIAIGSRALRCNQTGVRNIAIGSCTLYTNISGNNNTAIGYNSLRQSTGCGNTAVGACSLQYNGTGTRNTGIGAFALARAYTPNNTAIGYCALRCMSCFDPTTGYNTAVGAFALRLATCGPNTAVGNSALCNNTTGFRNVAIGFNSLRYNTTGRANVAVGHIALCKNTTGIRNIAIGNYALVENTTGQDNIVIGTYAMCAHRLASKTIAIGFCALNNLLNQTCTTSHNIGIGAYTDIATNTTGSVIIGRSATSTASNQFVIGSTVNVVGAVTTETCVAAKTWSVIINGVAQKILLA